jgi:hypothetical protein
MKSIPRLVVIVLENVNVYVYFVETWNDIVDDSSSSSSFIDDDILLGDMESIRPSFIVRDIFDVWIKFSTHEADKSNETLCLTPRRSCKQAFRR